MILLGSLLICLTAKVINGVSLETLENRMRAGQMSYYGFLGDRESLGDVLSEDDLFVRSQGLTHAQLAEPLAWALAQQARWPKSKIAKFKGVRYDVQILQSRGRQVSPFADGMSTEFDVSVINLETHEKIYFSGLMPELIRRYGFYQGRGARYRVEPSKILRIFPQLKVRGVSRSERSVIGAAQRPTSEVR